MLCIGLVQGATNGASVLCFQNETFDISTRLQSFQDKITGFFLSWIQRKHHQIQMLILKASKPCYLTIIPRARMVSESIAHEAEGKTKTKRKQDKKKIVILSDKTSFVKTSFH